MGFHNGIEFADFDVNKAWKFFKYNVRRYSILEVETLMDTDQVKELRGATSYYSSRSQLASNHKASFSNGLRMEEILFLWLGHLWARIRSKLRDESSFATRAGPNGPLPQA